MIEAIVKEHTFFVDHLRDKITVVDLGACHGEFVEDLGKIKVIEKAILVEANPTNFACLKSKPNHILYNRAITNKDNETIEFNEDPNNREAGSKFFDNFDSVVKHKIKTITLDKIIEENNIDFIDILKMDIEGTEYEVLKNLSEDTLKKIGQITCEFHDFIDPTLRPLTIEIIKKLNALGFCHLAKGTHYRYTSGYYDVLFFRK